MSEDKLVYAPTIGDEINPLPVRNTGGKADKFKILTDIIAEYNRNKGNAVTKNDWIAHIICYLGRAADNVPKNLNDGQDYRLNLVKAAALVLAAIESCDNA